MPKAAPEKSALNQDAERVLLGLIIEYPSSRGKVLPSLYVEDFQLSKHRKLFMVVNDLWGKSQDIDRVIVADVLLRTGQIEDISLSYLASLCDGLPDIPNPDSYIRILKEYRILRSLARLASDFDGQVTAQLATPDIISDVQNKLLQIERDSPVLDDVPKLETIVDALGGPFTILNPSASTSSIKTHFKRFDALTTGLEPGTLTIIAGRPSSGKTALSMCMAQNIAEHEIPVAIFSLEMKSKALIDRMVCAKASIEMSTYRAGRCTKDQHNELVYALGKLYSLPLFIDDKSSHSIGDIARKLDRLVNKEGVRVCFLDYVQLLTSGARQKGDRRSTTEVLGEAVENLKGIAKRLNIAFVLLSQLSRDSEKRGGDHRPMLSDLRDSGSLEQAADLVAFTYREAQYKHDRPELDDFCEVIVAKQRQGATGMVPMRFLGAFGGRFEDV